MRILLAAGFALLMTASSGAAALCGAVFWEELTKQEANLGVLLLFGQSAFMFLWIVLLAVALIISVCKDDL